MGGDSGAAAGGDAGAGAAGADGDAGAGAAGRLLAETEAPAETPLLVARTAAWIFADVLVSLSLFHPSRLVLS